MEILHSDALDFFFIKPGQLLSVHHYKQILGAKEKKKDNEKQWQEQLANQYNIPSLCVQSAPAVGPLSWGFIECTHVINPNKPTFVKNILKTSAQKSTFWSRSCTILNFLNTHRSLINSTPIKFISSQMFTGKCSAQNFTKNFCFLGKGMDGDNSNANKSYH